MNILKQKAVNLIDVLEEQLTYDAKENESIVEAMAELQKAIKDDKTSELLKDISYALNIIPNKGKVGRNGESSYQLAAKLDRYIRENK